jgi:hypothetical protein
LRAWYQAGLGVTKDANSKVSQLTDLSGHGSHVMQNSDATRQPLWVATALNGQPAVQFDGSTFLKTASAMDEQAGSNDVTVITVAVPGATQPAYASLVDLSSDTAHGFVVGQLGNATNQYQLWFMDAAQSGWYSSPAASATAGAIQVLSVVKNGATALSYLNGTTQGTATVPSTLLAPVAALAVGNRASGNYGYAGQIAEVLVYNRALSDTERQQIEAALTAKYLQPDPDSDHNGLPDAWEMQYFGHIGVDPNADPDGDGLTNLQEYSAGSNPVDYNNGRAFAPSTTSGSSSVIAYIYDASGRVTLADYSSGRTIQFTHDAATNLTAAASSGIGGTIVAWRTAHGLPGDGSGNGADTAILAGDGLPNLAKYAFGLDPSVAYTSDHPVVSLTNSGGNDYLTLTYSRPDPMPADLTYKVEVSSNGTTWTSGSGATVAVSTTVSSGVATVIVRDATAVGSPTFGRRIRLSIERRIQP